MRVQPYALPYAGGSGDVGVLLCHGFTGTTAALRPWAEHLVRADLRVELPRLPGHGTTWRDLNHTGWQDWYAAVERGLYRLHDTCSTVLAAGLSMGGCLALRLAEQHPQLVHGLVLVNPAIASANPALHLLPVLRRITPSLSALGDDVRRRGVTEYAYNRLPLHALHSLTQLWSLVRRDLPRVEQPILLCRSATDHVVDSSSVRHIRRAVPSPHIEERRLPDSYHVATLDHDAPTIFAATVDFARRVATPVHRARQNPKEVG